MGQFITKIWRNVISPWITGQQASQKQIAASPAENEPCSPPELSIIPRYRYSGTKNPLEEEEWQRIAAMDLLRKIKEVLKKKSRKVPKITQGDAHSFSTFAGGLSSGFYFAMDTPSVTASSGPDTEFTEKIANKLQKLRFDPQEICSMNSNVFVGRSPSNPEDRFIGCDDNEEASVPGWTALREKVIRPRIMAKVVQRVLALRILSPNKFKIITKETQGDQVDTAIVFHQGPQKKTAAALLFKRPETNAWIQLCYNNRELISKKLENHNYYDKDKLFIICPEESGYLSFQCASDESRYINAVEGNIELGSKQEESLFKMEVKVESEQHVPIYPTKLGRLSFSLSK